MDTQDAKRQLKHKIKQTYIEKVRKLLPFIRVLPKVLRLIQPVFYTFIIAYIFKFVLAALHVKKIQYVGGIADIFSLKRAPWEIQSLLIHLAVYYAAYTIITMIIERLNSRIVDKLNRGVRVDLYKNVLEKDMEFFDKKKPYEAINAVNQGIEGVQNLATKRIHGAFNPVVKVFGTLGLLYGISPELTVIVILIAPVGMYLQVNKKEKKGKLIKDHNKEIAQSFDIPSYSKERIYLIKAFSTEQKEVKSFIKQANKVSVSPVKKMKSFWKVKLAKGNLGWSFQLALFTFGGFLVMKDKLSVGDLISFNMYFATFISSIASALANFKSLLKSLKQSEELFKVLEYEPKIKANDKRAIQKPTINGEVSVNKVSFKYATNPQETVLNDVTLTIRAGESVGFTGSQDSGKSSLINLLQRLYEPVSGEILIDGNNIKNIDLHWLHQNIGFVPQKAILIDGTIEDNIAYGNETYTTDQLNKAFSFVDSEFLTNKKICPKGLHTKVGEKGTKLTNGQIQKIAIARALINEPKILIMDDVTVSLEDQEKQEVDNIISGIINMKNKTVIIASNNQNIIRNCDKIYRLADGGIAEQKKNF